MTYQHLIEELKKMSQEQLEQDVTVFVSSLEEYMPVFSVAVAATMDVLDPGHIVLEIE